MKRFLVAVIFDLVKFEEMPLHNEIIIEGV